MMGNMQEQIVMSTFALYLIGAIFSLLLKGKPKLSLGLGCLAGTVAGLFGFGLGIGSLVAPAPLDMNLGEILPGITFQIQIDGLSGFFLATICMVTALVSIYSWYYMKIYQEEHYGWWGFCYNLFVLFMTLVVTVSNAIVFLICWELMTLASYFLVTFEYQYQNVRKAGFSYLVMTHLGTVFIITAFFLLFNGVDGWEFGTLVNNSVSLSPLIKNMIFICALVGFGTKAGIVPLHIWLPMAHPAAPSNVSAVMSGVMLKTAIYGLVRVVVDLLGCGPAWWGGLILAVGVLSAVIGVLYALMEHDLKRLLAFHSVENIGIILMGVGTSLILFAWQLPIPAAMALAAGLFHVLNHAIFKSLLFLGTGSIYFTTHSRDIEELGGLIKRMPQTALLFLVGSISISALPPFNGFASEYQIYQALLGMAYLKTSSLWYISAILSCAALALTGALAAACFVKAFGISFLAMPRTEKAAQAREVPGGMRLSMLPLGVLCLALGVFPGVMFNSLTSITGSLLAGTVVPKVVTYQTNLALLLVAVLIFLFGINRLLGAPQVRRSATWGCGIELNSSMEYTAASFSQPIRRVYRSILQPTRTVETQYTSPYFPERISFEEHVRSMFLDYLYKPLRSMTIALSKKWQNIQSGNINLYLGYVFITLVVLLVWAK